MSVPAKNKHRQHFQALNQEEKAKFLTSHQEYAWKHPELFLFDKQVIPEGLWRYYLLRCGRGFGKTTAGSAWIAQKVIQGAEQLALCGPTYDDVMKVMVPAIQRWFPKDTSHYSVGGLNAHTIVFDHYPAKIHCYTSDKEVRGPNLEFLWCDEICNWCDKLPEKVKERFEVLDMAVRIGQNPQTIITSTPVPFSWFTQYQKQTQQQPERYKLATGTMFDNPTLPPSFIQTMIDKHGSSRLGRQELYGELLTDTPGALWKYDDIEKHRISTKDYLDQVASGQIIIRRTVVGVDPTVSASSKSDETGIVTTALSTNNHIYVTQDYSAQLSPNQWAQKVVQAANTHQADRIIAEKNNGGLLVEINIRSVDPYLPITLVNASKGKITRAEPVAALYERGLVHHVGEFRELEQQMTSYTGDPKQSSPDRMDALVWACTELLLNQSYAPRDFSSVGHY